MKIGKVSNKKPLRAHERISSQSLGVEAPAWQGAKVQEYLDIPSFRNAAKRVLNLANAKYNAFTLGCIGG